MTQTTLRASILGAMCALVASVLILAGLPGAACVLALVGASIPAGVLYVRFTA